MHRFHNIITSSFFLVIFNLLVSQSLGSWIYPPPTSDVFPVFNYIDIMNASWTTTIPEPHVLLIWCHAQESPKDYYSLVYNKTLSSGHDSQEVVFNFQDRAWEICHFNMVSTMNSSGKYEYGFNGPGFRISKTDASEQITWGEKIPGIESTSQIKAIPTSDLAENQVLPSDVFPKTQTDHVSSTFTPFTSSSSSFSVPPPRFLSHFASSFLTNSSAPLIPTAPPKLPPSSEHSTLPSSHTLSPTAKALIGVGIVVCLSLVLAIISVFSCNRERQLHQHQQQQQQHQGLFGLAGGGKAQQRNNNKQKQKFTKRHRYPLTELAGEEVANELEGSRPDCEIEGKKRERNIIAFSGYARW